MKLVKTLCILCVGTSLSCASDADVRPGTPYPGDYVSSTSVQHENQAPFPVVNQSCQPENQSCQPEEPNAEVGRHTPEVSTTVPGHATESDNKSVAVSGSGEESPLFMYDPALDNGKYLVHSDGFDQQNKEDHHLLRDRILLSASFVLHATALVNLLSNPVNLCEGILTKAALYMCLANSCVFSLITSGYAPEFVHMYSQYLFIVPMMVLVYCSAQQLQCAFDAG